MTDLEMTKLCADAMGLKWRENAGTIFSILGEYNPLYDDAQAMALVKKFKLHINYTMFTLEQWTVYSGNAADTGYTGQHPKDLNRAIVGCVARMQAVKAEADKRFNQPHYGHSE